MMRFSSADCQRQWGKVQDAAISHPIIISNNNRDRLVMMSVDEYERLKRRDRQVMAVSDFTDADLAALEAARAPQEAAIFDAEIKE
jgi:prevent-host-death family protein